MCESVQNVWTNSVKPFIKFNFSVRKKFDKYCILKVRLCSQDLGFAGIMLHFYKKKFDLSEIILVNKFVQCLDNIPSLKSVQTFRKKKKVKK